jgi:hypothetical protein
VWLFRQFAVLLVDAQAQHPVTRHWPWWLRLLAVLGVILFIRFAVMFARDSGRPQ